MTREDFAAFRAFCRERAISVSQAAGQALRALRDGLVPLAPARSPLELAAETCVLRGYIDPPVTITVPIISGTCGRCVRHSDNLIPTRIEPRGPRHRLCWKCHTEMTS